MENHVLEQLALLARSALLGTAGAALYDMLRSIRLRRRRDRLITHLLDGLYVVALLLAMGAFVLRLGDGELRLYMLLGTLLGAAAYYLLPAAALRPLWDFWVDVAAQTLRLLWMPVAFCLRLMKKFQQRAKKHFLFLRKYAKIKKYKREFIPLHGHAGGKGGKRHREKGKKT